MTIAAAETRALSLRMRRIYGAYAVAFGLFVLLLAELEARGMSRQSIGYLFLASTLLLYAFIGIANRTNDPNEYYVAGRRIPGLLNGMATAADWMSAASFMGLAGGLYLLGHAGVAFVMGWTGGYVLIAVLIAPYLNRFARWTIPDFFGARYGGHVPRFVAAVITITVSFAYVVAQIYGVGLITTWLTGVDFTVGIFLGLTGVLVCSFLGGMKAVTWTQVSQYIVLIIAYLVPVIWLSLKLTGSPLPLFGHGEQIQRIVQTEAILRDDPREREVERLLVARADAARARLADPQAAWLAERAELEAAIEAARLAGEGERMAALLQRHAALPVSAEAARLALQRDVARARQASPHVEPFPGQSEAERDIARRNFVALIFCLMIGTAALPHLLIRFYTTPTVAETRRSVAWSLFFILLLYLAAPSLALMVKSAIYHDLVGMAHADLPSWLRIWSRVDPGLVGVRDVNGDGIVQLAELEINQDIVTLASPEIAGLPYVVSGLVAAGGLAAALSTADGLLLTISNALSHDIYHKMLNPRAGASHRVLLSKVLLVMAAILAAMVAVLRPAGILDMVAAAFSLAASGLFPALVLGIFWKRATGLGATAGMIAGFGTTFFYLVMTHGWLREVFGVTTPLEAATWWGIRPIGAGVFGVPVGFLVIVVISLLTPRPAGQTMRLVDALRHPQASARPT